MSAQGDRTRTTAATARPAGPARAIECDARDKASSGEVGQPRDNEPSHRATTWHVAVDQRWHDVHAVAGVQVGAGHEDRNQPDGKHGAPDEIGLARCDLKLIIFVVGKLPFHEVREKCAERDVPAPTTIASDQSTAELLLGGTAAEAVALRRAVEALRAGHEALHHLLVPGHHDLRGARRRHRIVCLLR